MELKQVKLSEVTPHQKNPRVHPDSAISKLEKSIKTFGWTNPILLSKDGYILAGHARSKAAEQAGIEEVPAIVLDLEGPDAEAYLIADNRLQDETEWDNFMLKELLEELDNGAYDVELTGFDLDEIEDLMTQTFQGEEPEVQEDDFDVDENIPEEPITKRGDIYQLGDHRLMCGDSTSRDDVKSLMDGKTIHLLNTDPPYNVSFNGRSGNFDVIKNDDLEEVEFYDFINRFAKVINDLDIPTKYIWCNWKFYGTLQELFDFNACIVWGKNVFGLGKGYRHQHEFCLFSGKIDSDITNESDLWTVKKDTKYVHPTQKPIELAYRAINNHKEAGNILDLFGGSGFTLMACEQTKNKKSFTMELDERYCDVIINRWEEYTGQKAKLIEYGEVGVM